MILFKPKNQYEEGQQINLLRKLYQRAIRNPMNNLEDIWKEYDAYENELNKLLVRINFFITFFEKKRQNLY